MDGRYRRPKSICASAGVTTSSSAPPGEEQVVEKGRYEEIVEGSLLVFSIIIEGQNTDEATRVRVEFVESAGRTEVTIVEGKYSSKAARDMHAKGWSHCLDLLTAVVQ